MQIPQSELTKTDTNGTPFKFYWERYQAEEPSITALLLASGFKGRKHVIDYGCHLGGWVFPLSSMCEKVSGVDINPQYIESLNIVAKANNLNAHGIVASDLSVIEEADGIICIGTLQVVVTGDLWHQFFDEANRILKTDGIILFNVATPDMPWHMFTSLVTLKLKLSLSRKLKRQLGWFKLWWKAFSTQEISKGERYYAVPTKVVEFFVNQKGFHVIGRPQLTMPSYGKHYAWFLVKKIQPVGRTSPPAIL